jgi:diadenosine tetraphosphate (Ap4A) HIT family hydrolase
VLHDGLVSDRVELGPTGGVVWSKPEEWARRRTPGGCIICTSGRPPDVVAELPSTWAVAPVVAPLRGYVCVVARRHVNEPFELPVDEQHQFWADSMRVAAAVASVVSPIKMNYEIHGNTLPHLHLHLFPRHADDPFVGGPIDPRRAAVTRSNEQLLELAASINAT